MKFLFVGTLLWLRKLFIYLLLFILALVLLLYWVANSPFLIEKVAQKFAPDYNISYSRIYGNAITGVEIDDLCYQNTSLAKHITFKWNPNALIHKEIAINKIILEEVYVDTLKELISAFSSKDKESNRTTEPLPFVISIKEIAIDLAAFTEENISISSSKLAIKEVFLDKNILSIENIDLELETQKRVDKIELEALGLSMHDILVDIKALIVQKSELMISLRSNIAQMSFKAKIKENTITGLLNIKPTESLYSLYDLPIRQNAINELNIDLNASKEAIYARVETDIRTLLKAEKGAFNIDITSVSSDLFYSLEEGTLKASSTIFIDTPYAKDIRVNTILNIEDNITYYGDIVLKKVEGIDSNFSKLLDNLKLTYEGNTSGIKTAFESEYIEGVFVSKDFKKALLHLESKEPIVLQEMLALPKELNQSKASIFIDIPLSFESNASLFGNIKVRSNIINIDTNLSYKEHLSIKSILDIPKDSLLKPYSKELKWEALNPIQLNATLGKEEAKGVLTAATLSLNAKYGLESSLLDADMALGSLKLTIQGKVKEALKIEMHIASIAKALKSISLLYSIGEVPKIKGGFKSTLLIKEMKTIHLKLSSPFIDVVKDIKLDATIDKLDDSIKIVINSYQSSYDKQKIFASKASSIILKDKELMIDALWLNDELKVDGNYSIDTLKGILGIDSDSFHLLFPKFIDLQTRIALDTKLKADEVDISGKITLLRGNILYDLSQKTFASDSDIIIINKKKKVKPSSFMDNLSLNIQLNTQKPLRFNRDNIRVKSNVSLSIQKGKDSQILLLGSIELLKGGSYIFENKKFILNKSFIYFTGDMNKPLIDISVGYRAINHKITIAISGEPTSPHIEFTSIPSLTKEQILSIILFDSKGGAGKNSGADMMKMLGGVMAKSALSNLGIQVDSLVFGEGDSIEIGKKLSDKLTIIYINDTVSKVKLNYEHGRHTQSVIGASEESQSYDIVYKRDF